MRGPLARGDDLDDCFVFFDRGMSLPPIAAAIAYIMHPHLASRSDASVARRRQYRAACECVQHRHRRRHDADRNDEATFHTSSRPLYYIRSTGISEIALISLLVGLG